jgi:predicted lipoprotein with Yx(FWY)xxD motif
MKGRFLMRKILGAAGIAAIALTAAACGSSGSSSSSTPAAGSSSTPAASNPASSASPASSGTTLNATTIGGKQVLTNGKGMTVYWFVPDTSTTSKCTGTCATYWPPVLGPATAGSGVTGKLSTITRPDGTTQATYNGHPLYTYIADTSPGQDKGNGINASGGLWYNVPVSGSSTTGTTPTTSSSSHGGYGY